MARQPTAMFAILSLIVNVPSSAAAGSQLNANETFGSDIVKEMPLIIGAGLKTPLRDCSPISGSFVFTPKALRIYVFKGEDDDQSILLQADNNQNARTITLGNNKCQATLVVTRQEAAKDGTIDLPPELGSGVPGVERKNVLDEQEMYVTAAYFPSNKTDCGRLNTSFKFDKLGLLVLTNLANGFAIKSTISGNNSYRNIKFTYGACSTNIDVHFYSKNHGEIRQEEQK